MDEKMEAEIKMSIFWAVGMILLACGSYWLWKIFGSIILIIWIVYQLKKSN